MKLPPLETYDGTGDPYDHTNAYEIIMGYYNHTDAGMCKIFVTTLKKVAKQWIVSLPSESINSWKELSDKFHERFGSNKRRGKLTASLMQIKQRNDEPLGEYVQRFRDAVGTVTDLNVTQALGFFTTGLDVSRSKKLLKDIMFNPPKDLVDAYERAEKFMAIEDAMSNLNPKLKTAERPNIDHKQDVWDRIGPKQDPPQTEKFSSRPKQAVKVYTPLNTSRVQILNEIKGKSFYEPPKGRGAPGNQKYYCEYHQSNGHSTERCYSLKDLIEKNVQNGELRQYVEGRQDSGQAPTQQQPSGDRSNHPRRVVDVITGGTPTKQTGKRPQNILKSVAAVEYHKAGKLFPRSIISFTDEDYPPEAVKPHEGALVITAQVGPVDMKRIMVDNGSSVDILYIHAYQRMDLKGVKMKVGQETPLYGFGNEQVPVVGTIELPVTFGTAPRQAQISVKFFVVQVDSAYNAILGRTALSALHTVTSIPHYKMKFPTEDGVGEVKGDMNIARRCYQYTLTASAVGISKKKTLN